MRVLFLSRNMPPFLILFVASALGQAIVLGVSSWLPSLLVRNFGFEAGQAGIWFGLTGVTAALSGLAAAPRVAGHFRATGRMRMLQIGRAHVWTPVTNAHSVFRLLL